MKSWYEVLEVPESATTEQVRSAYLKLVREYHPDRVPEHLTKLRADAEDKFKLIQQAWAVLGDPVKRGQYDRIGRHTDEPPDHNGTQQWHPAETQTPSRHQPSAHAQSIRDFLRGKREFVKWLLIVLVTTLVLVVVGEVTVSRQSKATPAVSREVAPQRVPVTVPSDIHQLNLPPRHIQTWRAAGADSLEVKLLGIAKRANELELTFRVSAGNRAALLLYEPPGASGGTKRILGKPVIVDRDLGELYLEDSAGARYLSSTGFVGSQQTNFNLYNFTRRINFKPHEEVLLSAKFPPISHVSTITFVSPALGKWQPEWRWPDIPLK